MIFMTCCSLIIGGARCMRGPFSKILGAPLPHRIDAPVTVCISRSDLVTFQSPAILVFVNSLLIRPYLNSKTASTIAASIAHSKLDYCNSLYYNLLKSQINRLQQIQNCLARTVVKAPKFSHIIPILRYLLWLKINECIEYKLLSLTTKFSQPANLTTYTILSLFSLQVEPAPHL